MYVCAVHVVRGVFVNLCVFVCVFVYVCACMCDLCV